MSVTGWLRGVLVWAVAVSACTRDNPAYVGLEDAGVLPDGGHGGDGRVGDGGGQGDGSQSGDAAPGTCTPTTLECLANVLLKCEADGTWVPKEECPSLCVRGGTAPHCGGFLPSNTLPKCGHVDSTLVPFVAESGGPVIFDTDTFTITHAGIETAWLAQAVIDQGVDAPAIAVFKFDSFHVPAGATVMAVGSRALGIWAQRDVVVAGGLRAGGAVGVPQTMSRAPAGAWTPAAGWSGGAGGAATEECGFGGGGYGAAGGGGGQDADGSATAGVGGATYGSDDLVPLRGGSPGGAVLSNRSLTSGGGAVQIVACHAFTLRAGRAVSANGQGGPGGTATVIPEVLVAGGDGGGSGGAILIESPLIHLASVIAANGGGGGGGGALTGASVPGGRGEDGREDDVAAAGGAPASVYAGAGGAGGVSSVPEGGDASGVTGQGALSGGGGGGGAGRIRLNVTTLERPDLGIIDAAGVLVSPAPSLGTKDIW